MVLLSHYIATITNNRVTLALCRVSQIISMKLRTMKSQMVGQAWSKRAKEKELEKAKMNVKKEKLSKTQSRARGTYNKADPLHICETNVNCHRRDSSPQRCCVHGINKEEMQKKQRVIHLSILYTPFNLNKQNDFVVCFYNRIILDHIV